MSLQIRHGFSRAARTITTLLAVFALVAQPFYSVLSAHAATINSTAVYQGIPTSQPSTYPSIGFTAVATKEFGDRISLAGTNRKLDNVKISLTSWACQSGEWQLNNCQSAENATFGQPITVSLYKTTATDAVGALIVSKEQTIAAKYRPSADNVHCTGANAGKWYDGSTCYNGMAFDASFDFSAEEKILPNDVIATISFNTKNYGTTPQNVDGPYDSLNVSLMTTAPTIGTNTDINSMYRDSTYQGRTSGLSIDPSYAGYGLGININASPVIVPVPTGLKFYKGTTELPSGSIVGTKNPILRWNTATDIDRYRVSVTHPDAPATTAVFEPSTYGSAQMQFTLNDNLRQGFFGDRGDGAYIYTLQARSASTGVWSEKTAPMTLNFDGTAPNLAVTYPTNNSTISTTADKKIIVQGNFSDALSGANYVQTQLVYKGGSKGVITNYGTISDGVFAEFDATNLVDGGEYYFAVAGADVVGNFTERLIINFTLDTKAPLTYFQLQPDSVVSNQVVSRLRAEGETGKINKYVYIDSEDAANLCKHDDSINRNLDATCSTAALSEGIHTLVGVAIDEAGNRSVISSSDFIVDHTGPTITVKPESVGTGTTFSNVSFKLFDKNKVDKVTVNGVTKDLTDNAYSDLNGIKPGVLGAVQGENTVVAYDIVGNTTPYVFTLDSIAPEKLTLTAPADKAVQKSNDFYFTWNAPVDNGSPIHYEFQSSQNSSEANGVLNSGVWKSVDSSDPEQNNLTSPIIHSVGANGTWFWQVRAVDTAGNAGPWSEIWQLTIDQVAPIVTFDGYTGTSTTPELTGTSDADLVAIEIDGEAAGSAAVVDGKWSFDVTTPLDRRVHTIVVTAEDAAGNIGTTDKTVDGELVSETFEVTTVKSNVVSGPEITERPQPLVQERSTTTTQTFANNFVNPASRTAIPTDDTAVLGTQTDNSAKDTPASDVVAVAASPEGWKFFGIAWYWILLIIAAISALWFVIARRRRSQDA